MVKNLVKLKDMAMDKLKAIAMDKDQIKVKVIHMVKVKYMLKLIDLVELTLSSHIYTGVNCLIKSIS